MGASLLVAIIAAGFVILIRRNPELLGLSGKMKKEEIPVILAICAGIVWYWTKDWPSMFHLLAGTAWSLVLLAAFVVFAVRLGLKTMCKWLFHGLLISAVLHIAIQLHHACTGIDRTKCPVPEQFQPSTTHEQKATITRASNRRYFIPTAPKETTITLTDATDTLIVTSRRHDLYVSSEGDTMRYAWVKKLGTGFIYSRKPGVDTVTVHVLAGTLEQDEAWIAKYYPKPETENRVASVRQTGKTIPEAHAEKTQSEEPAQAEPETEKPSPPPPPTEYKKTWNPRGTYYAYADPRFLSDSTFVITIYRQWKQAIELPDQYYLFIEPLEHESLQVMDTEKDLVDIPKHFNANDQFGHFDADGELYDRLQVQAGMIGIGSMKSNAYPRTLWLRCTSADSMRVKLYYIP